MLTLTMDSTTPNHLGGHFGKTWIDEGSLHVFAKTLGVRTMVDIGCGPGGMSLVANRLGVDWMGIDGDPAVLDLCPNALIHDFTLGPISHEVNRSLTFDLGWSVEFLEHLHERFLPNVFDLFTRCRYVFITAAPPNTPGWHHVNTRFPRYWKRVFLNRGFDFGDDLTVLIKSHSTMQKKPTGKSFVDKSGMAFINRNLVLA